MQQYICLARFGNFQSAISLRLKPTFWQLVLAYFCPFHNTKIKISIENNQFVDNEWVLCIYYVYINHVLCGVHSFLFMNIEQFNLIGRYYIWHTETHSVVNALKQQCSSNEGLKSSKLSIKTHINMMGYY